VYKFVKTGETIEVEQSFSDPTLTEAVHPKTRRKMAVKKVFTPVGVTFRGDGFYKTDSRSSKKSASSSGTSTDSKPAEASSTAEKPAKEKPATKAPAAAAD